MTYSGIIFDFNGVLLWDAALQEAVWQQMAACLRPLPESPLSPHRVPAFPPHLSPAELALHVHGRANRHTLEYLAGRPLDGAEVARLSDDKEVTYRRLCLEWGPGFALSPGAEDLLDALVARSIPRAIATASGLDNMLFFVEHLGLERWFTWERIVYDDGRLRGKPAPDLVLEAARRLGLPPAHCLAVDDSVSGLAAAVAAGIGCVVGFGPTETHAALLRLPGVHCAAAGVGELLEMLT